jgi:hypothetical protein
MVAMQAHGVINSQHRVDHGLQFPGVSYAQAALVDHVHEGGHGHEHEPDQAEPSPTQIASVIDVADTPDDGPINHHHHSGGDIHVALASPAHPTESVPAPLAHVQPLASLAPPGFRGDGPSRPPKQQRLIA